MTLLKRRLQYLEGMTASRIKTVLAHILAEIDGTTRGLPRRVGDSERISDLDLNEHLERAADTPWDDRRLEEKTTA